MRYCSDCKWGNPDRAFERTETGYWKYARCSRLSMVHPQISDVYCSVERETGACGQDARYFEAIASNDTVTVEQVRQWWKIWKR